MLKSEHVPVGTVTTSRTDKIPNMPPRVGSATEAAKRPTRMAYIFKERLCIIS
jgi:hypothetical protein